MYLIESGADVNYAGAKIYAPLHWAVTVNRETNLCYKIIIQNPIFYFIF